MANVIATESDDDGEQTRRIQDVAETIWHTYPQDWVPKLAEELNALSEIKKARKRAEDSTTTTRGDTRKIPCPHCRHSLEVPATAPAAEIICGHCGRSVKLVEVQKGTRFVPPIKRIGDYELIDFLAAGAFGSVWKARDVLLLTAVAIKIPHTNPLSAKDKDDITNEARAQALLDHRNIVRIRHVLADGETLYIVSDLIRGISLSDWLSNHRPTVQQTVQWCLKISEALQHAHQRGVVHRDLKPGNILMDGDLEPHLTDFGLAKHDLQGITIAKDGQILGTAAYMSTEQADGRGANADGRTDIYSLGVVLFELLTGQLPFRGNERAIIHGHIHEPAPSPRKFNDRVPRDLETLCLKCLEKDPARRFQTAGELQQELERYLRGEPIVSRPIGRVARAWRWCKREPIVAGLSAAVVLALLAGTLVSSFFAVQAIRSRAALERVRLGEQVRFNRIARQDGYRAKVFDLVKQARDLQAPDVDVDELRQEAVACLGDFAGLKPIVLTDFPGNQPLNVIALDQGGTQLAAGFKNGAVAVYDLKSGGWTPLPERHQGEIRSLGYSALGSQLIAVDAQGVIKTWTRSAAGTWSHAEFRGLENAAVPESKFELTPDGTRVLARHKSRIKLWDIAHDKFDGGFDPAEGERLNLAAISPDHKWLAFTFKQGEDEGLQLSEFATGRKIARVPLENPSHENKLIFSPNSEWIAFVSDRELLTFDVPQLRLRGVDRSGPVKAVAFSPDSQSLATFGIRGDVVLRGTDTNQVLAALAHPRSYTSRASGVQFSGDGSYLASFDPGSIRLWRLRATPERITLDGHLDSVPCVVISPDGKVLVSASKDKTVKLWDPTNGALVKNLNGFRGMVQNAAFSPDGRMLATAQWSDGEDQIQFWDTKTWEPVPAQWLNDPNKRADDKKPRSSVFVCRIAFSPAGKQEYFASADKNGVVLWRMSREQADGGRLGALRFACMRHWPGDRCFDCAISPDGKLLAWVEKVTKNADTTGVSPQAAYQLRLWDLEHDKKVDSTGPRLLQEWHALAFSPDSQWLTFIGESTQAEVWRMPDCVQLLALSKAEPFLAPHIALSKNEGRWFAGKIAPTDVVVWDMLHRKRMFAFRSEASEVISLDWSPDGRRLAMGLHGGRVVVWDLQRVNDELRRLGLAWSDGGL